MLIGQSGPADAKAVTIATILRTLSPETRLILAEKGGHYLLGLGIPARDGDVVFVDTEDREYDGLQTYVVIDPSGEAPLGQVVEPELQGIVADGTVTNDETDLLYDMGPDGIPVKWINRAGRG
ncbi:hypothetical protein BAL199_15418 [alpha proteobacterium BAL199]|nr:hypothetical protein BAL199_15418 [alpha proteobacterium BAL199]